MLTALSETIFQFASVQLDMREIPSDNATRNQKSSSTLKLWILVIQAHVEPMQNVQKSTGEPHASVCKTTLETLTPIADQSVSSMQTVLLIEHVLT